MHLRKWQLLPLVAAAAILVAITLTWPAGAATQMVMPTGSSPADFAFSPQTVTIDVGDSVMWMGYPECAPHASQGSNTIR